MPLRAGGRERWCTDCERIVHDLSAHTQAEARALLRDASEPMCVAYRVRADGEVQFRRTVLDRVGAVLASAAMRTTAECVSLVELEKQAPEPEAEIEVVVSSREPEPEPQAESYMLGGYHDPREKQRIQREMDELKRIELEMRQKYESTN